MTRTEAARIAAVLPLPKKRGAVAPKGFTRRYGGTISARIGVVGRDGLDACVYRDIAPPRDKAPPAAKAPKQLPGEEFESAKPLPPLNEVVSELPPADDAPLTLNEPEPVPEPAENQVAPPPPEGPAAEPANAL